MPQQTSTAKPDFMVAGLAPNFIGYEEAWALQREIHAEVAAGTRPDTVIFLEHTSVFTAGKRTKTLSDQPMAPR